MPPRSSRPSRRTASTRPAQDRLRNLDEQRESVARAVGAVTVEGPDPVAYRAEEAAEAIEELTDRLRDRVASVVGGSHREDLVRSQMQDGREDQGLMQSYFDDFTAECRKLLHPAESRA
jgi:hypothetical protein